MPATIGLVGGLGPEGTIHYYQKFAARLVAIPDAADRPGLVIDHVSMDMFATLLRRRADSEVLKFFAGSFVRLSGAGANMALIAAVTPHRYLAALRKNSPFPIIDLVEATMRELTRAGYSHVGLLGTRATLTEDFFKGGLERAHIAVTVPTPSEIDYLDDLIFGALASGPKTPEMSRRVQEIVRGMTTGKKLDALVVACTDLMDLVEPALPLVDPVECHVALALASANGKT